MSMRIGEDDRRAKGSVRGARGGDTRLGKKYIYEMGSPVMEEERELEVGGGEDQCLSGVGISACLKCLLHGHRVATCCVLGMLGFWASQLELAI